MGIVPKVTKIAYDAVALIGSKDLKDSNIECAAIKVPFAGKNFRFI